MWLATNPWSTPNAHSHLPGMAMRLSPVSTEYARHAHPLSAAATQLSHLSLKYTHPTASCGYKTSHLALEYAHHAQPAAGVVAMWPSHFLKNQLEFSGLLPFHQSTPFTHSPSASCGCRTPFPRPFLTLECNHHLRLTPNPSANCATWPSRSFPGCQSPGARRPSPNYLPVVATQPSPLLPLGHAHYAHAGHAVATTTWPSPLPQIAPSRPSHQLWPHEAGLRGSY